MAKAKGRVCRIVDLDSPSVGKGGVEEQVQQIILFLKKDRNLGIT